jgi:hypothetical protein
MQRLLSFFGVCGVCRRNYSHTVSSMEINTQLFKGDLALWNDPRHRVGRAGFESRRRWALFYAVFFKTVRRHLNSILFIDLHYSAVRNKKRFKVLSLQQTQKYLCPFDDACSAADARFWYVSKYGN